MKVILGKLYLVYISLLLLLKLGYKVVLILLLFELEDCDSGFFVRDVKQFF